MPFYSQINSNTKGSPKHLCVILPGIDDDDAQTHFERWTPVAHDLAEQMPSGTQVVVLDYTVDAEDIINKGTKLVDSTIANFKEATGDNLQSFTNISFVAHSFGAVTLNGLLTNPHSKDILAGKHVTVDYIEGWCGKECIEDFIKNPDEADVIRHCYPAMLDETKENNAHFRMSAEQIMTHTNKFASTCTKPRYYLAESGRADVKAVFGQYAEQQLFVSRHGLGVAYWYGTTHGKDPQPLNEAQITDRNFNLNLFNNILSDRLVVAQEHNYKTWLPSSKTMFQAGLSLVGLAGLAYVQYSNSNSGPKNSI